MSVAPFIQIFTKEEAFIADMESAFHHKFSTKPQVIEGNMKALRRSMQEVQGL